MRVFRRFLATSRLGLEDTMNIPQDPVILLSYVNTKLRDEFSSLDDLCQTYGIPKDDLCEKLEAIDYEYDTATNQFV